MLPMKSILRAAAVVSSIGLLLGCVWFTQKQANPTVMPGSKSGTLIMPGSKSFTSGTTVSANALKLQTGKPAPDPMQSSKSGPMPAKMIMSGSKSLLPPVLP